MDNFLHNRKLAARGREDLRPLYFIWTVVRACNFRCSYCDDHRGRKYPDLPSTGVLTTQQGLELLEIMRTGTPSVYFAGGEPTLRKDLPTLTRAAWQLNYYPISINTNGSTIDRLLTNPRWDRWLADTDIVIVSLDSLDPSTLQDMWAYRKPLDVLRNLLVLRELSTTQRFKLMINTVIQPGSIGHARDVLDFAADAGIWFCPVPMNVGPRVHPGLAEDAGYRDLVRTILHRKQHGQRIAGSLAMNERLLNFAPLQCRNALKPHIDHDGRLFWPCKASVNVEPHKLEVLGYPDLHTLYEHARQRLDPAGFHGQGPDQCGAHCNWAQNYTTDRYAHGLRHPLALVREVADFIRT